MGIRYFKLFDLLKRRNMKISDLRTILSSATVAKLNKGEHISGEAIEKICAFLNCQPGDIMEYIDDNELEREQEKYNKLTEKAKRDLLEQGFTEKQLREIMEQAVKEYMDKEMYGDENPIYAMIADGKNMLKAMGVDVDKEQSNS